jgi:hypothetical protein
MVVSMGDAAGDVLDIRFYHRLQLVALRLQLVVLRLQLVGRT